MKIDPSMQALKEPGDDIASRRACELSDMIISVEAIAQKQEETETAIERLKAEISRIGGDLKLKLRETGDALKIGEQMAVIENGIRVLRGRVSALEENLKEQSSEFSSSGDALLKFARSSLIEYLDRIFSVRVAALRSLVFPWRSAFVVSDQILRLASDSEDYAPFKRQLERLKDLDDAKNAVALLASPLRESLGTRTLEVRAEWSEPRANGRIREGERHLRDDEFNRHSELCHHHPKAS